MLGHTPSTPSLSTTSASHRSSFSQPLGDEFNELADTCRDLQNQIDELKSENGTMKATIEAMQDSLRKLGDKTTGTAESAKATKSIANQHKKAKVWDDLIRTSIFSCDRFQDIVHAMFWTLCGVDSDDANRYDKLKPLASGEAVEIVDECNVWHPIPGNCVDDPVNRKFIKEVVDRVMDDEKVSIWLLFKEGDGRSHPIMPSAVVMIDEGACRMNPLIKM
jgi:hypothetical protein